jgi:hypothetical protein
MNMIAEGTYLARAKDFQIRSAMNAPTEWVDVTFEVKVSEDEVADCTWMGFLTKKAMERTIEALRFCGWYGDEITNLLDDGLSLNEVEVVIQHEEYKGKTRARIAFVNKIGSGQRPLDEDRIKSLADRVREKAKTMPGIDPKDAPPF